MAKTWVEFLYNTCLRRAFYANGAIGSVRLVVITDVEVLQF